MNMKIITGAKMRMLRRMCGKTSMIVLEMTILERES